MKRELVKNSEKASIWQQLKSNKIAVISSYTISKSVLLAVELALVINFDEFNYLANKGELYFPIIDLHNFLEDFVFILLIAVDTILFSFLIKNLIKEISKKTRWFLSCGFLITPFLYKTITFSLTGKMIKQFQNEINYMLSDSIVLISTLFALIFKVSLCYILLNWFKQKKETYSLFKINVRHFLWFFIPALGYGLFFLNCLIYFVVNYVDHISKLKYLSRAWWISDFTIPVFAFVILSVPIILSGGLMMNLEVDKKNNVNRLAIIFTGIISPLCFLFFQNQILKFISFIGNFLINYFNY
jgi:hypothetical protein